jgi:hypothetical protein
MASCWARPNEANAISHLVDAKSVMEIRREWDEECKLHKRMYDVDRAKGWATGIDKWRQWAGKAIFDSSVKIKEWEAEGWYNRWLARTGQDDESE